MSDMDNLNGSSLGGPFKVFCLSELLEFQRPISSGVSALVAGIIVVSGCLEELCWALLVPCSLFVAEIIRSSRMD